MKVILEHDNEKILLKNYKSYLELDKDILSFRSLDEVLEKLGLHQEEDKITILDNDGNPINFDFQTIRTVNSFYENKKGDEFVSWIFISACDNYHNKKKLTAYFDSKILKFTKGVDSSSLTDINNPEGRRLYGLTDKIRTNLYMFNYSTGMLRSAINYVIPDMENYVKKDKKYNYYYMRKFILELTSDYNYNPGNPRVKINGIDLDLQASVVNEYKTSMRKHYLSKLNERTNEEIINPIYDEDGNKIDEIPFVDSKKLYL